MGVVIILMLFGEYNLISQMRSYALIIKSYTKIWQSPSLFWNSQIDICIPNICMFLLPPFMKRYLKATKLKNNFNFKCVHTRTHLYVMHSGMQYTSVNARRSEIQKYFVRSWWSNFFKSIVISNCANCLRSTFSLNNQRSLTYVICVCFGIVMSNICRVLFFFVLLTICYQFFWIVDFWLPIRYSLTFIYYNDCISHQNW